jgi:hypothetical protein
LTSGLAQLVFELAKRICAKLGVSLEGFLEYVLNNGALWSDPNLTAVEDVEDDDDQVLRSLDEYIADLDVAILSLIDDLDTAPEELAAKLDEILKDSLWKRTLAHVKDDAIRSWERELIVSRARWLWAETTVDERRACFSAGLGHRAGTFLHRNIDALMELLVQMHSAVVAANADEVAALAVKFAEAVTTEPFFSIRKLPDKWQDVLTKWVSGAAFAEILNGLGVRQEQRTQAFVQDGVVFRLVWAAEAVRVQALSSSHDRAAEVGDGPMLALTHGVPSIPAALLCQAGYASRVGALWLTNQLPATFADLDGMREWVLENDAVLAEEWFWESEDHRVLWNQAVRPARGDFPRPWNRRTVVVPPRWVTPPPPAGTPVRLITRGDRSVIVCSLDLSTLGNATLTFKPDGAVLQAVARADGKLQVTYFGPN